MRFFPESLCQIKVSQLLIQESVGPNGISKIEKFCSEIASVEFQSLLIQWPRLDEVGLLLVDIRDVANGVRIGKHVVLFAVDRGSFSIVFAGNCELSFAACLTTS